MSSIFTPSSIPPGSTVAGSPFAPGGIPGSGGGLGAFTVAGVITYASPLVMNAVFAGIDGETSSNWPTANLAILVPFSLPTAKTVTQVMWINGAAAAGNLDAGVYNEDGTRVVTCGTTAQGAINNPQVTNLSAPTALAAGSYYFALCQDVVTGGVFRNATLGAGFLQMLGVQQAATSLPLPASLTLANPANAYLPTFAIGFGSVM